MIFRIFGSSDTSCYIIFYIQLAFMVWIKTDHSQTGFSLFPLNNKEACEWARKLLLWNSPNTIFTFSCLCSLVTLITRTIFHRRSGCQTRGLSQLIIRTNIMVCKISIQNATERNSASFEDFSKCKNASSIRDTSSLQFSALFWA